MEVTGTVSEFFPGDTDTRNLPTTRIINPQITILSNNNPLPTPVLIGAGGRIPPSEIINTGFDLTNFDPTTDGIDFFESLESMRVTAQSALAIVGTNQFSEIFTVVDNGANASGISQRGTLNISPNDFNPEKVQVDEDSGVFNFNFPSVVAGAQLGNVTGVISYSFGNFEILPTEDFTPNITSSGLQPESSSLSPGPDQLTIAAYNVLNLDPKVENISLVDDQDEDEIDDDLGDGRFDAIAAQIVNNLNSPDIIGLQEVQDNDGAEITAVTAADVTLQTLIDRIVAAGGPTYAFIDNPEVLPIPDAVNTERPTGGQPGGNIRTAFLYNPARVSVGTVTALAMAEDSDNPGTPFFEARIPLAAEFIFNGNTFTVVNNHFSSKGGSAPILGVEQPFDQRQEEVAVNGGLDERQDQSAVVQTFVADLLSADSDANIAVIGDLNEFEFVSPVTALESVGLTNLINDLPPNERYSFIFQGNSQQLDHILVSNNLLGAAVDVVHVNSEFPATDSRASDHDPVLARVSVSSTAPTLNPGDVQIIGFQNRSGEAFSFVVWEPLAMGTQISFTDDSVGRNDQFQESELDVLIWEADQPIPAGTVVVIDAANGTADLGTVVQFPVGPFSLFGDQLFAFQGAKAIENLLFGLNFGNEGWLDQALLVTASRSFLPTSLDVENGNIDAGPISTQPSGQYLGDRQNAGTVAAYQDLISNNDGLPIPQNWEFSDDFFGFSLDSTDFNLGN